MNKFITYINIITTEEITGNSVAQNYALCCHCYFTCEGFKLWFLDIFQVVIMLYSTYVRCKHGFHHPCSKTIHYIYIYFNNVFPLRNKDHYCYIVVFILQKGYMQNVINNPVSSILLWSSMRALVWILLKILVFRFLETLHKSSE